MWFALCTIILISHWVLDIAKQFYLSQPVLEKNGLLIDVENDISMLTAVILLSVPIIGFLVYHLTIGKQQDKVL